MTKEEYLAFIKENPDFDFKDETAYNVVFNHYLKLNAEHSVLKQDLLKSKAKLEELASSYTAPPSKEEIKEEPKKEVKPTMYNKMKEIMQRRKEENKK